jgi:hypothetical protein
MANIGHAAVRDESIVPIGSLPSKCAWTPR